MKKVLVFLADGCEMCEALCVVDLLRRAGISVTTAGVDRNIIHSAQNVIIEADTVLERIEDEGWDCVFCPGGMPGAENLHRSERVNEIIMTTYNNGGIVSAICASPAIVLAPIGILDGRRATCFPGCEEYAPHNTFSSDGVVVDKSIITAKSVGWAFDLGLELIKALVGPSAADKVQGTIYYK